MVCTANDLSAWKDFPKGLRVLLLEKDSTSSADIKSKLEAMDYVVSIFCNENEALSAVADNPECYHVAIVEVNTSNSAGSFKFLETAKDLPTITTSDVDCLSVTMKCIALGAVEFLRKPISEDKLRNIWQHVVHKAFNAGGSVLAESLKPVKDFVASTLQLELDTEVAMNETIEDVQLASLAHEGGHEQTPGSDKYPAPSTPQLKQGLRLLDDGDCQDHTYSSTEKECGEQEGESKSVETTTFPATEVIQQVDHHQSVSETVVKEEDDSVDCLKSASNISSHVQSKDNLNLSHPDNSAENPIKVSSSLDSCGTRASRKKSKIDWTPELHKKFVQAVEQLGVEQVIPSRILEVMKVEGLTRHNVASHLQKYRMHRRHILPKEDDRKWLLQRDRMQRSYYPHKPIVAYPPYHSNQTYPYSPLYPLWGTTGSHLGGMQMWRPPGYPPWPQTESWHWKPPYLGMQADAWGCPVMPPPPPNPYSSPPPNVMGFHDTVTVDNVCNAPQNSFELHPAEEVIDMVVKEAMSKPWLPLPLGLKPPATESVLAELSRQGISRVPPNKDIEIKVQSSEMSRR